MNNPTVFSKIKNELFQNLFPQIEILGTPLNVFVETLCYNIKIPIITKNIKNKEIDLFEETILRMKSIKNYSVIELSEILCLEKDFIEYIINQLNAKSYLSNSGKLTSDGNIAISKGKEDTSVEKYELGKIFVIRDNMNNCRILPYIKIGEIESELVTEINSNKLTVDYGTKGKPKPLTGICIRDPLLAEKNPYPNINSDEIERIIKTYNLICNKRNINGIAYANNESIACSFDQIVYFHMQGVLQQGFVDEPIFSDGFVPNIQDIYNQVKKIKPEILSKIKEKAITIYNDESRDEFQIATSGKYWQIHFSINRINRKINEIKNLQNNDSANTSSEIQNHYRKIIIESQRLLEWGFMYYCKTHTPSIATINLLKNQSPDMNGDYIFSLAEKKHILFLGKETISQYYATKKDTDLSINQFLNNNPNLKKYDEIYKALISHIYKSDIERFFEFKEPNLYTGFPLFLLEACENSENPVYSMQEDIPEYLSIIRDINFFSRGARHTRNEILNKEVITLYLKCKQIIKYILPDACLDTEKPSNIILKNIANNRLKAIVSLEHWMGSQYFNTLDYEIQNEWIQISPDKNEGSLPDTIDYLLGLSRILEAEYAKYIKLYPDMEIVDKYKALLELQLKYNLRLPDSISKVSDYYYECAFYKGNSTLGAELLVLLLKIKDQSKVNLLLSNQIVETTDKILKLRKHGANVALSIDIKELNYLREEVLKITKLLGVAL